MVNGDSINKDLDSFFSWILHAKSFTMKKWLLIPVFAVVVFSANAQFTYLESGVSYEFTSYDIDYEGSTVHHNFKWNIGGIWRPIRKIGLGATLGIPFHQNSNYSFQGNGGRFNIGSSYGLNRSDRYWPDKFDYNFNYSPSLSLIFRWFFYGQNTGYFDLRLSHLTNTETFQIERSYQPAKYNYGEEQYAAIPELIINYKHKHSILIPGMALGFIKAASKRLSVNMNIGFDFLIYRDDPFEYKFTHEWNNLEYEHSYVTLKSKAEGVKTILSFDFSFNYTF